MPLIEPDSDFLLTRPEEIRSAIFELTHQESHVLVRDAGDRETAVLVLGIDRQTGHFFWRPRDYAGSDFASNDSRGLRVGTVLQFHGNGYGGVQIHFRVPRPELVRFDDGSAAFVSPLPERVSRIQRRKLFRASIVGTSMRCAAQWRPTPALKPILFTIRDISVEGIGLRAERPVAELPERGSIMEDVYLDFGDFGNITTDLEVRNVIPLGGQAPADGAAGPHEGTPADAAGPGAPPAQPRRILGADKPLSHIGAVFVALSGRQEAWLQQVVWRLEKARTAG
ncbi:flagellar brake protein [Bordetella genomosp. 9]|uniref:flagellar brake protein n=1 Tax=Bordetella genomosp. 9 TaxID=1416803 RepID=UPI000A294217|nr:flagellar brake protein [Bordetella genomosp. 9]ARP90908.1 flagellar brake protein [Bordetella genomosp. 9]